VGFGPRRECVREGGRDGCMYCRYTGLEWTGRCGKGGEGRVRGGEAWRGCVSGYFAGRGKRVVEGDGDITGWDGDSKRWRCWVTKWVFLCCFR